MVRYYSDSSVEVLISCDENGMGATTVMAQIAATVLELPIENIKVIKGDTILTPFDNYSASSRTTYTTGNAVMIAAQEVKDKRRKQQHVKSVYINQKLRFMEQKQKSLDLIFRKSIFLNYLKIHLRLSRDAGDFRDSHRLSDMVYSARLRSENGVMMV